MGPKARKPRKRQPTQEDWFLTPKLACTTNTSCCSTLTLFILQLSKNSTSASLLSNAPINKFLSPTYFNFPSVTDQIASYQTQPNETKTNQGAEVRPGEDPGEIDMPELPDSSLKEGILPALLRNLVARRKQVKGFMKDKNASQEQYFAVAFIFLKTSLLCL